MNYCSSDVSKNGAIKLKKENSEKIISIFFPYTKEVISEKT